MAIFESMNWLELLTAIIATIASASIIGIWRSAIISKIFYFQSNSIISFEGYWVAKFYSHMGNFENIEIVHIRQYVDRISLKGWSYSGKTGKLRHFDGKGLVRGQSLAMVYAVKNKASLQTGVLALKASQNDEGHMLLKGIYGEFDYRGSGANVSLGPKGYDLRKIALGPINIFRLKLGWRPFENFSQVEGFESEAKDV